MPGLPSANSPTPSNSFSRMDNNLYRCLITKVLYVDDMMNVTTNAVNPQIIYEAVILGGFMEGQAISNIRLASWLGGQYNYAERVLRAASRPTNEIPLAEQDGDIVFIQFIQGDQLAPIIIGLGTQPLDGEATGAVREDGPLWVEQYNGVETKIDNEGNYSLLRKGGELEDGVFVPNEMETDYTGSINLSSEQLILKNDKNTITLDKENDKISITNDAGVAIELDGSDNISIKNSGGMEITITSSGISIKGGDDVTVEASSIKLNGGEVNVGEGASFKSTLFENLKEAFDQHTHLDQSTVVGMASLIPMPTSAPLAPLLGAVGSGTVKVSE